MSKNLYYIIMVIFFSSIVGCSSVDVPLLGKWVKQPDSAVKPKVKPVLSEPLKINEFVDEGRIANAELLTQGRNIAFMPFRAGVDAEATVLLDKIALRIVKGISDAFSNDRTGKHTHFTILTVDDSKNADIHVKGYVTSMKQSSKFQKWFLLGEKKVLSVSGKLTDVKTGETLVVFSDQEETTQNDEGYHELGYRIGGNIGQFILSGVEL